MTMNEGPETGHADVERVLKQLHDRQIASEQEARTALAAICAEVAALGVDTIRVSYDGYGDSGNIESVKAYRKDEAVELLDEMTERITDAACDLLPGGWEINEGSFGDLVIDVEARKITREHNWRIEETDYDEEEFAL